MDPSAIIVGASVGGTLLEHAFGVFETRKGVIVNYGLAALMFAAGIALKDPALVLATMPPAFTAVFHDTALEDPIPASK